MKSMRAVLSLVILSAIAPARFAIEPEQSTRPALKKSSAPNKPAREQVPAQTSARAQNWLERIRSRADFDRLARIYYRGRFYAVPHLMFVIDRQSHGRVYYINSKAYSFHKDFVNATYLSLERGRAFYENNYLKTDRRFLLGTVAYQTV